MNGYTIEGSIDLLERDVKKLKDQGGGGGGGTAASVSYDHTGTSLVATNVQAAITELDLNVSANVEDIEDLQTDVNNLGLDKQDKLSAGTGITINNNVISSPMVYSTDEKIIGKWIDGSDVAVCVFTGLSAQVTNNNWSNITPLPSGVSKVLKVYLYFTGGQNDILVQPNETRMINGQLSCNAFVGSTRTIHTAIVEYTKTT